MAIAHLSLVQYIANLGYKSPIEGGLCFGLVHMWVQAILCNDLHSFVIRLNKIEKDIQKNRALTLTQRYNADIMQFLDGVEIYHKSTRHYRHLLDLENNNVTFQQDAIESSKLAASLEIEKQGGLHKITEFTGVYNHNELFDYFKVLSETLKNTHEPFALVLDNVTHVVGVSYDVQRKKWIFCDANQLPIRSYKRYEHLCEAIMRGFQVENDNHVIMNTTAYTTKQNQKKIDEVIKRWKNCPTIKSIHQVTEHKANKRSKNNDSWLFQAASINDTETLSALMKIKDVDRNIATKVGKFAPIHAAASNGSTECLKILLADDKVDTNSQTSDGSTALYIAAFSGHIDCVKLLLKYRKANPTLSVNNISPLEAALHFQQFKIAWELFKDPRVNKIDKLFKHPFLHGLGGAYTFLYIGYFILPFAMFYLLLGAMIVGIFVGSFSWLLQKYRQQITKQASEEFCKAKDKLAENHNQQLIERLNQLTIPELQSLQTGIQSGQTWKKYYNIRNFFNLNATWQYKHYLLGLKLSDDNYILHNKFHISNLIKRKQGTSL